MMRMNDDYADYDDGDDDNVLFLSAQQTSRGTLGVRSFLTCKHAFRQSSMHVFWCYLQKVPWSCQCYWDFDLQMCFSPQQGALFADPFPKWHPNPPASRAYLSEHPGARNDGKQSHIFDFLFGLSDWLLQLSISRIFGFQTSFNYPSNTLWWWAAVTKFRSTIYYLVTTVWRLSQSELSVWSTAFLRYPAAASASCKAKYKTSYASWQSTAVLFPSSWSLAAAV